MSGADTMHCADEGCSSGGGALWEPVPAFVPPEAGAVRALARMWSAVDRRLSQMGIKCRACGRCCDFRQAAHVLFAAKVELDVCLAWARDHLALGAPEMRRRLAEGLCPFWSGGRCEARPVRPSGCRIYFCDDGMRAAREALAESVRRRLARLSGRLRAAWWYGPAITYFQRNVPWLDDANEAL